MLIAFFWCWAAGARKTPATRWGGFAPCHVGYRTMWSLAAGRMVSLKTYAFRMKSYVFMRFGMLCRWQPLDPPQMFAPEKKKQEFHKIIENDVFHCKNNCFLWKIIDFYWKPMVFEDSDCGAASPGGHEIPRPDLRLALHVLAKCLPQKKKNKNFRKS